MTSVWVCGALTTDGLTSDHILIQTVVSLRNNSMLKLHALLTLPDLYLNNPHYVDFILCVKKYTTG